MSCLQEVSTNIDTVALAAPHEMPPLPRVPAALQRPDGFALAAQRGTKPLRGHGGERLAAFYQWALARPEPTIVVAGHSLWFQYFFREYLPAGCAHDATQFKIANGGVVACDLCRGEFGGKPVLAVRPESIRAVHKGFDLKKKKKVA